jgi:hypothetical protein
MLISISIALIYLLVERRQGSFPSIQTSLCAPSVLRRMLISPILMDTLQRVRFLFLMIRNVEVSNFSCRISGSLRFRLSRGILPSTRSC